MSKRPEVTLGNWREVYEFYGEHRPSKLVLHGLHRAASLVYRPNIGYIDDAEQKLEAALDEGTRLFIVSNHLHVADQFPIAAMMQRGPMCRVIGDTVTLAKQPYFTGAWRLPFDALGAVPVYREQDINGKLGAREQVEMSKTLFRVVASRVLDGASVLMFPEGTRNHDSPRELRAVGSGIGRMVLACAGQGASVAIVPVGLWPGEDRLHSFTPNMAVGEPLVDFAGSNFRHITSTTAEAMTEALQYAQAMPVMR